MRLLVGLVTALISACANQNPPIKPVSSVNLNQYMGDWYVLLAYQQFLKQTLTTLSNLTKSKKMGASILLSFIEKMDLMALKSVIPHMVLLLKTRAMQSGVCNSSGLSKLNILLRILIKITPALSLPEMPETMFG